MRGETMKDKSKKSTYSTTFGIDPIKKAPKPSFERFINYGMDGIVLAFAQGQMSRPLGVSLRLTPRGLRLREATQLKLVKPASRLLVPPSSSK